MWFIAQEVKKCTASVVLLCFLNTLKTEVFLNKIISYLQNTARGWRFSRCPQSALAPTGQDEVNWQTWWGCTPHGRAKKAEHKEQAKQQAVRALSGFWQNVVVSCALLALTSKAPVLAGKSDNTIISFLVRARAQNQHGCISANARQRADGRHRIKMKASCFCFAVLAA